MHHVAVTLDGDDPRLYLDGGAGASTSVSNVSLSEIDDQHNLAAEGNPPGP